MKSVLLTLLSATRGGPNRGRILYTLDVRPRNASRLAARLDLDDETVRHHLAVLSQHGLVHERDEEHGTAYLLTDRAHYHWGTIETITGQRERLLATHGVE